MYFDGDQFSPFFDGSDVGISGFDIDALGWISESEIRLSFTSSGNIPGIADEVDDSGIVKFMRTSLGATTSGSFARTLFFDGSNFGISDAELAGIDLTTVGSLPLLTSAAAGASVPQSFQTSQQTSSRSADETSDEAPARAASQPPKAESQAISVDNVDQVMAQLPGWMTEQERSEARAMDRLRLLSAANDWE